MGSQKLSRQSLHLVLNGGCGLYSLSRMDVSGLFYPSTAEAVAAQAKANKKSDINKLGVVGSIGRLPGPSIHFKPFRSAMSDPHSKMDVFALFGKNKILCSDATMGYTSIYNSQSHSILGMPMLNSPKGPNYIAVSIPRTAAHAKSDFEINPKVDSDVFHEKPHGNHTDSLYIMDMVRDPCCFEVLACYPVGRWRWRPLPPPPFFTDREYNAPSNTAFAVVGGSKICASSATATYSFDTVTREWNKAGDWVLPFFSKAEYVPELRLWLGLSACSPYNLCAMDLSNVVMSSCDMLPTVQHVELDVDPPKDWSLKNRTLVNLGSRKFCIANFFDCIDHQVVVFTALEVVPYDDSKQGELRKCVIEHKSESIVTDSIQYVL